MSLWLDQLRFLWEELPAPPQEVRRRDREEPTGVPRLLRKAARFASAAVVATSLMSQVIGVRLIAPVDAQPSYHAQCVQDCNDQHKEDQGVCKDLPPGPGRGQCQAEAAQTMQVCKKACGNGP